MRFEYFKLGSDVIKTALSVTTSKAARNRTEYTNLNGNMLIDQGALKTVVNVRIALPDEVLMTKIDAAVAAGFVEISFYEGNTLRTMMATIQSSERTRAHYLNGNRAAGTYYDTLTIELKER